MARKASNPPEPPVAADAPAREAWGRQLAEWRDAQGLSQDQAAVRLEAGLRSYRRWESGNVLPHVAQRRRIWGGGSSPDSGTELLRKIERRLERIELQQGIILMRMQGHTEPGTPDEVQHHAGA